MKRVHILSTVNAANVSKDPAKGTYTVRNVCGAVDDLVMNGMLYPAAELAKGAATLEGKPAPAGHPKNEAGQYISANSGDALLTHFAGAVCRNARHEAGRTVCDIVINEAAAKAHPDGAKLVERLDAALNGTNTDPIHVSTGVLVKPIETSGESRGKQYSRIATDPHYDHLAFLLHERGAGTPEDGVGMFLNAAGGQEPVEAVAVSLEPEDKRSTWLTKALPGWLRRLVTNGADLSYEQITDGLYKGLPENAWLREVFDRYAIWTDRDGRMWRQDYSVSSDGSVAWSGTAQEVRRDVTYVPVSNRQETDTVKDRILAALNAAGIKTEGLDDAALLDAYNQFVAKPHKDAVVAANSKLAEIEANARKAEEAEVAQLAGEFATNSKAGLTADDFKAMGLKRLRELKTSAAPVVTGGGGGKGGEDEFASYDLNADFSKT